MFCRQVFSRQMFGDQMLSLRGTRPRRLPGSEAAQQQQTQTSYENTHNQPTPRRFINKFEYPLCYLASQESKSNHVPRNPKPMNALDQDPRFPIGKFVPPVPITKDEVVGA